MPNKKGSRNWSQGETVDLLNIINSLKTDEQFTNANSKERGDILEGRLKAKQELFPFEGREILERISTCKRMYNSFTRARMECSTYL